MSAHDLITVEPLPPGSVQLRVLDQRRRSRRDDGKPPFIGTAVLAPSADDPTIGVLVALLLKREATESSGWRHRLMQALVEIAREHGYRRLVADTGGRPRAGWHDVDHGWIAIDIEDDVSGLDGQPLHEVREAYPHDRRKS